MPVDAAALPRRAGTAALSMGQQGCWVQITRVPIRQQVWQQTLQVVTQFDAASAGLVPETNAARVSPRPRAR
jgi:hypothetical protein